MMRQCGRCGKSENPVKLLLLELTNDGEEYVTMVALCDDCRKKQAEDWIARGWERVKDIDWPSLRGA